MSRVLVTGGAGFIGSHVVKALVGGGHDVAIFVRPNTSIHKLEPLVPEIRVFRGDVEDPDDAVSKLGDWRPETCAHLAWYAEPNTYLQSTENVKNLTASLALLPRLAGIGCTRFVITGTCAEYAPSPARLREESPVGPETLYGACKLALQMVTAKLAAQSALQVAWARIFHLYGPFEYEQRLVPAVIRTLLRDEEFAATSGEQVRDYLHVHDVASALRTLIENGVDGTVNVCSGEEVTVRHLIETIANALGHSDQVTFGAVAARAWDPPYLCGDNTRLVGEGWAPRYDLRGGIEQTIEWWRAREC
jgi:UDP-glucuronate decarboxylase